MYGVYYIYVWLGEGSVIIALTRVCMFCPVFVRVAEGQQGEGAGLTSMGLAWFRQRRTMWSYYRAKIIDKPRPVARGGRGGRTTPRPPVAHPKDFVPPFSNFVPPFSNFVPPFSNFVPPFSNFVPPFSNFVPPFSNFVPPFSNFVPPFSNFVPPFSNFVPPLEYVDDVTRAMSKGGVLANVQEWGRFSNWWRHADNVQGGGVRLVFHPSKFRPPPPGWLATGLQTINNISSQSPGLEGKPFERIQ